MIRIISITLIISLLICPVFAFADTEQTLVMMSDAGLAPIQAAAASDTNVWINGYNTPSSMSLYYFGSGGSVSTGSYPNGFSQLPGLFNGITYSIAYSISNLSSRIVNSLSTINTYIDGLESSSSSTAGSLSNIYTRLATTNSYIDNLESYVDGIEGYINDVESSLTSILTAIQNQSFTIPQSLIDDVDNISTDMDTLDSRWSWSSIFNTTSSLPRYRQNSEGGTSSDLSVNPTVRSIPNQIWYWLSTMNTSMVYAFRDMTSGVGTANTQTYLDKNLQPISMGRTSFWRDFRNIGGNINDIVARLGFVLANDSDIDARQAASSNTDTALDYVIRSSGPGGMKPTDITGIANLKSDISNSVSSGVSVSNLFNETGSSGHAWDWFTTTIQDELSAPSGRSDQRSGIRRVDSDTPMLDAYYHDLQEMIGIPLW